MSTRGPGSSRCIGALTGAVALMTISCTAKEGYQYGGANPILGDGISNELDALAILDPEIHHKVEDCIDNAKFKIYTGDPYWKDTWIDVGESEFGLRNFCDRLASHDPATFDEIHLEWVAWEPFVATPSPGPSSNAEAP